MELSPRALRPNLCVPSMQAKRALTQPIRAVNAKGMPELLLEHLQSSPVYLKCHFRLYYMSSIGYYSYAETYLMGPRALLPAYIHRPRMPRACQSHFGNIYNHL